MPPLCPDIMPAATPSHTPRAWDSSSHPHTQAKQQRPTPAPRSSVARTPASVGQPMPPPSHTPAAVRSPLHLQQDARTPSPNYFGFTVDAAKDGFASSAAQHARANFSPPGSSVRSTAAASPRIIPLDQNPEFEAFRRQSETYGGINLGRLSNFNMTAPKPPRTSDGLSAEAGRANLPSVSMPPPSPRASGPHLHLDQQHQRSPKRVLSSPSPNLTDRPRRNSPASFPDHDVPNNDQIAQFLPDDRHTRLSLPPTSTSLAPAPSRSHRAETLPANLEGEGRGDTGKEGPILVTAQHVVNLLDTLSEEILLLDLRVSTQYFQSRITGALNLCIPTTLLKRPSFNVQKLAETFKDEEQKQRFERWRSSKYIVVYDASSSQLKDATTCVNTLNKFTKEGWKGALYIIQGGFTEFVRKFPSYVTQDTDTSSLSSSPDTSVRPAVAPVIGGCPMPATKSAANPFFGNIRQNMDLIGGVGQMPVKHPASMSKQMESNLPSWLQKAADDRDNGRTVADKFLQIEKREQKRMQEALSGNVTYGTPGPDAPKSIQIAGIEKGSKNRYNNIWPYEHSRVRLQGVSKGDCDYVNANHVKAAWSNKRYIATQGPIPATFNDFWMVVWQQDVRVIVRLTAEKEGGQVKAHNYWEAKRYGPLQLNFLSEHRASLEPSKIHRHKERRPSMTRRRSTNPTPGKPAQTTEPISPGSDQPYIIVRRFTLSHEGRPFERMREITQLQYSSWPDFGAPAHPAHLLGLVEQCDAVVRSSLGVGLPSGQPDPPDGRPVLVHCSAGCGRTGTFCTVDSVIDMLKRQQLGGGGGGGSGAGRGTRQGTPMDVDTQESSFFDADAGWVGRDDADLIEKTVEDFRHQRLSMVQSLRQFVLCYESVLEWLAEQQQPKTA